MPKLVSNATMKARIETKLADAVKRKRPAVELEAIRNDLAIYLTSGDGETVVADDDPKLSSYVQATDPIV